MDESQSHHLKAYGVIFRHIDAGNSAEWLLNYRGGAFVVEATESVEKDLEFSGVSYESISNQAYLTIIDEVSRPDVNQDVVKLEKSPKIAVYSPKSKQPWDDAVTLVLSFVGIPYDIIYDEEILADALVKYNWLHLHHEDFTFCLISYYR